MGGRRSSCSALDKSCDAQRRGPFWAIRPTPLAVIKVRIGVLEIIEDFMRAGTPAADAREAFLHATLSRIAPMVSPSGFEPETY
jgi:hypothetical protein